MLSYLYRLATAFERTHGHRPNLVYINRSHYRMLQQNLAGLNNEEEIAHLLKMDIIISPDTCHPDVAWVSPYNGARSPGGASQEHACHNTALRPHPPAASYAAIGIRQ